MGGCGDLGSEIVWDDTPIPPFLPASGSVLLPNDDILRRDKYEKQVKLYWVELKIGGRKLMLDMFKAALKFHIASQGNFKLDKKTVEDDFCFFWCALIRQLEFDLRKRKREVLEEDEDLSEDEVNKAKSAFDGDLLPSDWELPEDKTGAFD